MSKQIKVVVNGNPYDVEINDLSQSPMTVVVNGNSYTVTVETGTESSTIVKQEVQSIPASIKSEPSFVKTSPAASASSNELHAPMPGLIVNIVVKPGDKVTRGQSLMALEAMKMKNAIRSPREGVIQSVPVSEGQKVAYNDLLVTFE